MHHSIRVCDSQSLERPGQESARGVSGILVSEELDFQDLVQDYSQSVKIAMVKASAAVSAPIVRTPVDATYANVTAVRGVADVKTG
jgi:hypothetical protein